MIPQIATFANPTHGALFDVLPYIFQHALPSYESPARISLPRPRHAPLNITHVCRLWRSIALSTPYLWSKLRFEIRSKRSDYEESYLTANSQNLGAKSAWVKTWLERSGGIVPLDLCVNIPAVQILERLSIEEPTSTETGEEAGKGDPDQVDESVLRVLEVVALLFEQRHRWRNVKIDVHMSVLHAMTSTMRLNLGSEFRPISPLEDPIIDPDAADVHTPEVPSTTLLLDNLASAEQLSIRLYEDCSYSDAQPSTEVSLDIRNSVKLQNLEFRGPWPRLRVEPSHIPNVPNLGAIGYATSLKRVELNSGYQFTLERLVAFLASIRYSLEEFVGVLPFGREEFGSALHTDHNMRDGPVILSKLHTLVLVPTMIAQFDGAQIAYDLLRSIVVPNLESLQVALPQGREDAEAVGRAILGLLSRPGRESATATRGRGVRKLKLSGTIQGNWLAEALPELSNLQMMELNRINESEEAIHEVLEKLSSSPDPQASLQPSPLHCPLLEDVTIGGVRLCEDVVAAFVEARTRPCSNAHTFAPAAVLRSCTFRMCRFFSRNPDGGSRRTGYRGNGMQSLLRRKEVRRALTRGMKIVFA